MADFTPVRSDRYLWGARLIQLVFAVVILAVTGDGASLWKTIDCNIPAKLAFNIAAAGLTLPALIYLCLSCGPKSFQRLPWHHWTVLTIDAFLVILWVAAAATSVYDCGGVCSACTPVGKLLDEGYGFWIQYGSLFCECYFPGYDYVKLMARRDHVRMVLEGRASVSSVKGGSSRDTAALAEKSINIAAKRGLDIVMIFLFLTTLLRAVKLVVKAQKGATPATDDDAPEHGVPEAQMSGSDRSMPAKAEAIVTAVNAV